MPRSLSSFRETLKLQAGPGNKPLFRQALEILRLSRSKGINPSEYYAYGFPSREFGPERMDSFVSGMWHWRNQIAKLNQSAWVPLLRNKYLFHQHFSERSFPLPRWLGIYNSVWGFSRSGSPLRNASDILSEAGRSAFATLVCKPVAGTWGTGVLIISRIDVQRGLFFVTPSEDVLDGPALENALVSDASDAGFLLEERVASHPFCQELNPFTASTIRVITLRSRTGSIHVPFAAIRVGRRGAVVDNVSQGGVLVQIDPATGVMGSGRQHPYRRRIYLDTHPDTGFAFRGKAFPQWDDVLSLCIRAAEVTPGLNTVGWDVLLSPEGPILLEGNHDWGVQGTQVFGQGYVTQSIRSILGEYGINVR